MHGLCLGTYTIIPWPFQHMFVKQLINFETFISTNENIFKYSLFYFTIIFENFNIFENNIINVELAKVLRKLTWVTYFYI
jgi:hypothetical protein